MIDNDAKFQFAEIITHEMFEMQRTMGEMLAVRQAEFSKAGGAHSGRALLYLTKDATNSLKARGQVILSQLLRIMTVYHVELTQENLAEAIKLLDEWIDREEILVRAQLFKFGGFDVPAMAAAASPLRAQFAQEAPRLKNRLGQELKLAAMASKAKPAEPGTTYNFAGPVGVVQSGTGNQATVTQNLTADVRAQVISALDDALTRIDAQSAMEPGEFVQLRELVIDTKAEAESATSNPLKLGSSLRTIAETTKFVGSLAPAYEVIKPLLGLFGIHIP